MQGVSSEVGDAESDMKAYVNTESCVDLESASEDGEDMVVNLNPKVETDTDTHAFTYAF